MRIICRESKGPTQNEIEHSSPLHPCCIQNGYSASVVTFDSGATDSSKLQLSTEHTGRFYLSANGLHVAPFPSFLHTLVCVEIPL
jgi:hypothetical protein